jgi:hypothetical protein
MKANKMNGSFGIPEDLLKEVNKVKEREGKPRLPLEEDLEYPEEPKEKKEPPKKEVEKEIEKDPEKDREELLEEIKKSLGIELNDDDLWGILFDNSLTKSDIIVFPGRVHVTFKYGLSVDEMAQIDEEMAKAMEYKMMEAGFQSLNTRHLLSHVLLEVGKPDKLKSIGNSPKERFAAIGKMNSILVEMIAKKWNMFLYLIDDTVKRDDAIKK